MKNIKIVNFIIITTIILSFPSNAFAANASLTFDPTSGTFNKGCPFTVNVVVDTGGAATDGTDAIVFYDTSRLEATSVQNGTAYPDYPGNNIDSAGGKITISGLASVATAFTGKGTLAVINFKVKDNASTGLTQLKFDFDPYNKSLTTDSNIVERGTIADVLNSAPAANYTIGQVVAVCPVNGASPGPSASPGRGGPGGTATPSALLSPSPSPFPSASPSGSKLPDGGTAELTSAIAIVGGILTVLGILGLALL